MHWLKKFNLGKTNDQSNAPGIVNNQLELEKEFLEKVTYDDVDYFHLKGLQKWAKVVKTYDSDTATLVFFLNGRPQKWRCRFSKIDTAEKTSDDPAEVEHALKALDRLNELIGESRMVWVKIHRMDKYHRPLIEMFSSPGYC